MSNQFNDDDRTVIIPQNQQMPQMPPQQPQFNEQPMGQQAPQYTAQPNMFGQAAQNNMYNQQDMYAQQNMYQQAPQYNAQPQMTLNQSSGNNQPPKKKKTGLIVGIIVALLVAIAVVVCCLIFIPKSKDKKDKKAAEKPIEKFFDGYDLEDLDYSYDAFCPDYRDYVYRSALASAGVSSNKEFWDMQHEHFGDDLDITYEITDTKKVSNLDKLEKNIANAFDSDIDIKKAYEFKVEETYEGSNGTFVLEETITTGKVDGEWYVVYATTDRVIEDNVQVPTTEEPTTEEPTTEEPTTEEPTTEATTAAPTVPAGDFNWSDMQFYFNGVPYNLGNMTYADIVSMGYTLDDSILDQELADYEYSSTQHAYAADGSSIGVRFKNFTGTGTKKARDCEILGISFDINSYSNFYTFALGNGITSGMTMDEVRAIMGVEPEYEYIDGEYGSLEYEANDQAYANSIDFTFPHGTLDSLRMENYD